MLIVGTIPKFNPNIVERDNIDTPNTKINSRLLSCKKVLTVLIQRAM
jgi:hypothetical protein